MLVVYRVATGEVVFTSSTNSAFRTTLPIEFEKNVKPYLGGAIEDYGGIWLEDDSDETRHILTTAGFCEVVDGQLFIYDRLVVEQPAVIAVGDTVEIIACLPASSPDVEVTFELAGETVAEQVISAHAAHLYQFAAAGTYRVTARSAHHGSVTVEVGVA